MTNLISFDYGTKSLLKDYDDYEIVNELTSFALLIYYQIEKICLNLSKKFILD